MQIRDKCILSGEEPHTKGRCYKAKTRGDKEETTNNFSTLSNPLTTPTQALMSDNMQRIIKHANSIHN